MSNRREFIKTIGKAGALAFTGSLLPACNWVEDKTKSRFKISLAEWSLHESLFSKKISNLDFPKIAKNKYGVDGVEYVTQFFQNKANDRNYLNELLKISKSEGVNNVLIMVDEEGNLASSDQKERERAVENHYKWVDAAKTLECHSVRVNLHGECKNDYEWMVSSIESMNVLAEYGKQIDINVIVENHGQHSSKGNLLAKVMKEVNNPYCGTLPDLGNFCVQRRDGDLWVSPCIEEYDKYKGVEEMLPYAKGISAKTFAFDTNGNEASIDYSRMFELINKSNYSGYIGIEYEGGSVSEDDGIKLTKTLIKNSIDGLNKQLK
jgi:sugar phosphate isomerase/epimerase